MFDAVRNNKKVVQVFLLLITLPFAFWGVDSYVRNMGKGDELASVGGNKITPAEFQQALRSQQERLRASLGEQFNPAMLDNPEARRAVLENLINQRLLSLDAAKHRLVVSDAQMRDTILAVPGFQENGQFSQVRYEALIKAQGMNQAAFEARLRQDLALQQIIIPLTQGVLSKTSAERVLGVQLEERTVSEAVLAPQQFMASVKLGDDAVKTFYEANRARFEVPAQVRAEFLVLNQDSVAGQIAVSDADVRKAYEAGADRYRQGEERRASHILIQADKGAGDAAIKAAREKAEAILKQVKAAPGDFARLAKANSQDPGSAEKGGDLGFFGRGVMVKPFEDAAFALAKEGDMTDLVQSDFGFHIIRLTGIKAAKVRPLEEVKDEIVTDLRKKAVSGKLAEMAEGFSNTVYEQSDSLKPAAEKYKLTVQTSDWIVRGAKLPPPFDNERLVSALFADDAVKNKRNTDAIDVGGGTLVAARVAEYKPAALRAFEEVKPLIEKRLMADDAAKLAVKEGEARLAKLQKGEATEASWGAARVLQRGAQDLPPAAAMAVFRVPSDKLPGYAGAEVPGAGYVLYRIEKVQRPEASASDPRLQVVQQQYGRVLAELDFAAYIAALRQRYDVKINTAALEGSKDK